MKKSNLLILLGLGIGAYALMSGRKKAEAASSGEFGEEAPDVVEEVNLEEYEMPVEMPKVPLPGDPDYNMPYIPEVI